MQLRKLAWYCQVYSRVKFYLTIDSAYELVWRLLREMRIYREGDKIEAELDGSFLISAKLKQQIEAD